jgi:hypothetical protein
MSSPDSRQWAVVLPRGWAGGAKTHHRRKNQHAVQDLDSSVCFGTIEELRIGTGGWLW